MIALAMLSLSTIELRSGQSGKAMAEAQANARMALMLAIGELQKHTGQDTRITANADLLVAGAPPLTGVWKSWEGTNHDSGGRPIKPDYGVKRLDATDGDSRFLAFLVSGAKSVTDPTSTNLSDLVSTTETDDTIALLSTGSLGSNPGQVHVEPQTFSDGSGRYAWWVSPENQKSRVMPHYKPRNGDAASLVEKWQSHSVPNLEGYGLKSLQDEPEDYIHDKNNPSSARKVISLGSTQLLADDDSASPELRFHDLSTSAVGLLTNTATGGWRKDLSILSEKWSDIYDDYSTDELPLFRLSPAEGDTSLVVEPTRSNYTPDQSTLYPWSDYSQFSRQKWPNTWHAASSSWQSLVNFATLYKNFTYSAGVAESPFIWSPSMKWRWQGSARDATNQEFFDANHAPRLHPVIARFQFIIYVRAYPDSRRPGRYGFEMIYSPVVTLWNPYNVRLSIDNPGPPNSGVVVGGQRTIPGVFASEPRVWFPGGPDSIPLNRYRLLTQGNMQYADTNGNFGESGKDTALLENISKGYSMHGPRVGFWKDIRTWGVNFPTGNLTFEPGEVRMFSANGDSEGRFGGAAWGTNSGYEPSAPLGIPVPIRGGNVGANDFYWFSLKNDVYSQPFRFRSAGRGFHVAFGKNTGASYSGGILYNSVKREMMSTTALANGNRASVYWPDEDFEPHGYTIGEIASVPAMPLYAITMGPRLTIGTGSQSRPTKGFLQNDPLAGLSLVDPGNADANSHPANGNFEMSYDTLAYGSTLTPNLSNREGFIVTGYQSGDGLSRLITHELPLRPMASLVELQGWNPRGKNPMPPYQSHLIGNSDATPMIPSDDIVPPVMSPNNVAQNLQHDDAYCANHLLFDDFFVSSIAPQPVSFGSNLARDMETVYSDFLKGDSPLTNRAYRPITIDSGLSDNGVEELVTEIVNSPDGDGWLKVASRFEVDGMFNVNSTSVEAWKALLGHAKSIQQIAMHGDTGIIAADNSDKHAITRGSVATNIEAGTGPGFGSVADAGSEYTGYRSLSDNQIEDLAQKIVEQVRLRGPFLSLSEFVNRQLSNNEDLALAGAIQSAINNMAEDPMAALRDPTNGLSDTTMWESDPNDDRLDGADYQFEKAAEGDSAYGAPGWMRQADILRPIAPILSARDDTFTIRAYGDARDRDGNILARAWCEATVQRSRDFFALEDEGGSVDYPDSVEPPSIPVNQIFGRRYIIKSFRWLNSNEI
ncbi:MAG: hypothetical protein KJO21_12820 [Verrucomicrobiae bacterium]|nr:hypothetical protein [Verrucomicrobiae bacterium]NNJ44220.1 hypothetical protein [Akkermansiaceae bacterium]